MRPRILLTILFTALFVILSGCGTTPNCPTCGTTVNGAYAIINVIAVPEHNPTGEPGGPFNSFDISTIAPNPAVSRSLPGLYFRPYWHCHAGDRYLARSRGFLDSGTEWRLRRWQWRQSVPHRASAQLHGGTSHALGGDYSADRRCLRQLRQVCLQDRYDLGERFKIPSEHGLWSQRQPRGIPWRPVLRLARQRSKSHVRSGWQYHHRRWKGPFCRQWQLQRYSFRHKLDEPGHQSSHSTKYPRHDPDGRVGRLRWTARNLGLHRFLERRSRLGGGLRR